MEQPIIGQKIYVQSSIFLSHGADDFIGGLATIAKINKSKHLPEDHCNYLMISIEERPGTSYNWKHLLEQQDKLKKEYGDQIAHPDPDMHPDVNCDSW